ncbi:TerC family protein, partial [Escherichia coli]|uniref:TerC family protein n=1 Tax=Escherichia coli TaxID=562 RepID=UPI00116E966B
VQLLQLPWLKLVGAVLLLWIGAQLLADNDADADVHAHPSLWAAVRTILVADLVMSLDNVIAVAAAAHSAPPPLRLPLLLVGLG